MKNLKHINSAFNHSLVSGDLILASKIKMILKRATRDKFDKPLITITMNQAAF